MIRNFREYGDGARIDADLCIVGTGPAGLSLAHEFLGTQVKVVLVESGGLKRDSGLERLNAGESVGVPHRGAETGRTRRFGGGSRLWPGQCVPFEELDFERRDWIPHSGWPFAKRDLDPYYRRAEAFLRIGGESYDATVAARFGVAPPRLDRTKLGYGVTAFMPQPDLSRLYRRSFSAAANVVTLLHATGTRVNTTRDGSAVDRLEIASPEGVRGQVRARAHVLCAGGIENARLLLVSNDARPSGIGNGHDLVGRFFQDHLGADSAEIETDGSTALQELFADLQDKQGVRYHPKLVLAPERQRAARVLNCDAELHVFRDESGAEAARRLYEAVRGRRWSSEVRRDLRRLVTHPAEVLPLARRRYMEGLRPAGRPPEAARTSIWLGTNAEQTPNPDSRVSLSRRRDRFGSPLPRIDWGLTDLDRRTIETFTNAVASELERLGLARLRPMEWLADANGRWVSRIEDSYHHMGTTRMADDERRGVVDEHCAVYGCRGLYVAGSSIFPTSGRANPTLTIVALSLRLADRLKATVLR